MFVTAIIAAGGRGQRFGGRQIKQLVAIGGRQMLQRSVDAFLRHPEVNEVVVSLPPELLSNPPSYLGSARIVAGGERRQDSVANAFAAASTEADVVVVHDAARPFASADLISRTIAAAAESGAAVAAIAARDTVKLAVRQAHHERDANQQSLTLSSSKGEHRLVESTLPRESIYLAQTPQAFRRSVLRDALARTDDATDEATLAERAGHPVRIVDGEASNIKITTPEDLVLAEAIANNHDVVARGGQPSGQGSPERLALRQTRRDDDVVARGFQPSGPGRTRTGRAGIGYDLHRLVAGRPLVLGGVTIPFDRGALGHSDADVVCHAVTDAILGAACLGDIGVHFPDTDPRWKDASSLDLLARAAALVAEQGLEVGNVDVSVILEMPKITPHIDAMRSAVAAALRIDAARVSIKGKTNEGVDAIGRGEAIAAHAVALVRQRS